MNRTLIYSSLVFSLLLCCISAFAQKTDPAIHQKVDQLLKQMTIEEKVGQLNQYTGKALTGPASEKKIKKYPPQPVPLKRLGRFYVECERSKKYP
jgi:beta-glucosidase